MKAKIVEFNMLDSMMDDDIFVVFKDLMRDPTPEPLLWAVSEYVKSRGISDIAKKTGLGRESLYKFVKNPSNCRYSTVHKIMSTLNVSELTTA